MRFLNMNRCYWGMNLEICKSFAVHPSEIALASVAKLSPVSVSDQFGKLQIKVSGDGFVQAHPDHIDCDTSNADGLIELSPNASVTVRKPPPTITRSSFGRQAPC